MRPLAVGSVDLGIEPDTAVPQTLSAAFSRSCSGCHGAQGNGKGGYPPVPGKLGYQTTGANPTSKLLSEALSLRGPIAPH